jgi:hypothetical protein
MLLGIPSVLYCHQLSGNSTNVLRASSSARGRSEISCGPAGALGVLAPEPFFGLDDAPLLFALDGDAGVVTGVGESSGDSALTESSFGGETGVEFDMSATVRDRSNEHNTRSQITCDGDNASST